MHSGHSKYTRPDSSRVCHHCRLISPKNKRTDKLSPHTRKKPTAIPWGMKALASHIPGQSVNAHLLIMVPVYSGAGQVSQLSQSKSTVLATFRLSRTQGHHSLQQPSPPALHDHVTNTRISWSASTISPHLIVEANGGIRQHRVSVLLGMPHDASGPAGI